VVFEESSHGTSLVKFVEDLKTKGEDSEGNSVGWVGVDERAGIFVKNR
jgi:hypothetical protein